MYFMLWNAQFNNWWALKSVPSTDQFWVRKLSACVWSRIPPHYSCLLWSWETDLYLDLLKAFDKKRAVNMIVKFRLHSLWLENGLEAWGDTDIQECIIRHPVDAMQYYSVHLQKTKKRWVKYLIFQTSFLWGFIWEKQWRCAWKCGSIIFFLLALMVRKGHWDPLLRPPKLECFWHQDACLA